MDFKGKKPFGKNPAAGKPSEKKQSDQKFSAKNKGNTSANKVKGGAKRSLANVPAEWLYLVPQEIGVRQILESLDRQQFADTEIWEDAGILEIPVADKASIDIEAAECDLGDEFSNEFLKEHGIKSLFMVTLVPAEYEKAESAMKQILSGCGGFFCGDTEDFMPQVK